MTQSFFKTLPIRLDDDAYQELRNRVLQRDGWRCQMCGSRRHLEVHHQLYRSHSGEDSTDNLITLCHSCHSMVHETSQTD